MLKVRRITASQGSQRSRELKTRVLHIVFVFDRVFSVCFFLFVFFHIFIGLWFYTTHKNILIFGVV